jgi:hypothetical protein
MIISRSGVIEDAKRRLSERRGNVDHALEELRAMR